MYCKTTGIVLRETDYRDNDKLLTVLTQEYGKLTVKARGVKSARSRSKAACQLLAYSEFTLSERQERYVITETEPLALFAALRDNIELLSLASYFAQVTETVALENEPQPELLSLLLNALYALAVLQKPQALVRAVFEFRLACIIGFLPDLRGCVVCGREDCGCFNVSQGVLQCAGCRSENSEGLRLPVSAGTLAALRFLSAADSRKLFSFTLSEQSLRELSGVAEAYLSLRLERGFYTLDFYKSLFL